MRKAKVLVRKGKRYVRTDPFQRALNLARKKYDKAENELAKAREKIEHLSQELPGLQQVIAGLEEYFGIEHSFEVTTNQPIVNLSALEALRHKDIYGEFTIHDPEPPEQPAQKPRQVKAGTPQLFSCRKCGAFTAIADGPAVCSKCGSADLEQKNVAAPSRAQPNGAGISTAQVALTPAGDDDAFLTDDAPAKQALT